MQYKSLFCIKGRDNWQRFSAISGSLYLTLLLGFVQIGGGGALIFLALLLAPLLGLSALRRVRDIERPSWLAALTLLPFIFFSLSLAYSGSAMASLTCGVIAGLMTVFLSAQKSKVGGGLYQQGYSGPLVVPRRERSRSRVEPTLGGEADEEEQEQVSYQETEYASPQKSRATFELWLTWAKQNQKRLIAVLGGALFLMMLSSLWSIWGGSDEEPVEPELVEMPAQNSVERDVVTLPDGFSLVLEGKLLIMRWLGEADNPGVIWSLATAEGDRSCANLVFNNGSEYRPIIVEMMPDTSIEARFTPLDTGKIITDIALRGEVKLCGYEFSLKGSQSALSKSDAFIPYL